MALNDKVSYQGRTTLPFGARRHCDVCGLLEAEHVDVGGNDCYRRAVAAYFPASAPARQRYETPLEAHQAAVSGARLQIDQGGLWKALRRAI